VGSDGGAQESFLIDADAVNSRIEIRDLSINFGASSRLDSWQPAMRGVNINRADNVHITRCRFSHCRAEMVGLGNFGALGPESDYIGHGAWITDCYFEENVRLIGRV